ncbi:hypothetical protein HYFRA_00001587 [Hymenoscyphus fraxineus]|uniref:Uncharacterized protein n=1 Tax=Hymenoscyphus fraxineus TaxID=746836 RepID=A0A9N9LA04_9HELO|nr:hypothetical protein HYFRA_00001587 [Hymenoscyphus fraxineus]
MGEPIEPALFVSAILPTFPSLSSSIAKDFALFEKLDTDGQFLLYPKLPKDVQVIIWEKYLEKHNEIVPVFRYGLYSSTRTAVDSYFKPHPLASVCQTSRWTLQNSKEFKWTRQSYAVGAEYRLPDLRYVFTHPRQVFVFETCSWMVMFLDPSKFPTDLEVRLSQRILIATAVKVVVIERFFTQEFRTPAAADFSSSTLESLRPAYNVLLNFPCLNRLIIVKPSWVDSPGQSRRSVSIVRRRMETLKSILEDIIKERNDIVSCTNSLNRSRSITQGEATSLTVSSWWKNPKIEYMTSAEYESAFKRL